MCTYVWITAWFRGINHQVQKGMGKDTVFSTVERAFIAESGRRASYESERIPTIEVVNVGALGKLACLRFLEYVRQHPQGVVALPTGEP